MKVADCENCGSKVNIGKVCPHCNHTHSEKWIKKNIPIQLIYNITYLWFMGCIVYLLLFFLTA